MHNQNVQLQNHLRSEMDLMIAQHYLVNVVGGGSECVHVWGQVQVLHVCGRGHSGEAPGMVGVDGCKAMEGRGGGLGCLPSRMAVLIHLVSFPCPNEIIWSHISNITIH